jgi:inner membrane protein
VFVDIFNAYGTQAVRPLNGKWLALGIINIFDPFIFGLHLAGLAVWALTGQPGITFAVIYVILTVYYVSRTVRHHKTVRLVKRSLPDVEKVFLSPTLRWANYHMAAESADHYYVGKIDGNRLRMINTFERRPIDSDHPAVKAALADKNVRAFRSFSPIYHWRALENSGGYMIQFIDLRYFARGTYPFTATVRLNKDLTIQSSYTGWVYSRKKLERKLVPAQTKI